MRPPCVTSILEQRLAQHDSQLRSLVAALRELMSPSSVPKRRQIGFVRDQDS